MELVQPNFNSLMSALKEYAEEVRYKYRNRLILDDKFASGKLIQNLKTDVKARGQKFEVFLYLEDYWKYVEEGRKPGKRPPFDKILEWVNIKPVLPEPDEKGNVPKPETLAFLIGRKIGEEGIKAGHQLKETLAEVNMRWIPRLQEALNKDIENLLIRTFTGKKLIRI